MKFWIDVEDLFAYAEHNARPSGIQRVAFELMAALEARRDLAGRIGYLRRSATGQSFRAVPGADVAALYRAMTAGSPPDVPAVKGQGAWRGTRIITSRPVKADGPIRRLALRLPTAVRVPLGSWLSAQRQAGRHAGALCLGLGRVCRQGALTFLRKTSRGTAMSGGPDACDPFVPGARDVVLALGAPWSSPHYAAMLQHCRTAHGMRVGVLIYDVIPLLAPEWCPPGLSRVFGRWFDATLPVCDHVFAVSNTTRRDVLAMTARRGIVLEAPVTVMPIGTKAAWPDGAAPSPLGAEPGDYIVVVGTIEARKNHAMLLRVWRRLLADRPPASVPRLVFAGRIGWLVDDLMHQLEACHYLDGKIVVVPEPSDAEIATLYRDALMTVIPSYYEGWGLPVSESQAIGRLCVISSAPALMEAAQGRAPSFDPDSVTDAVRVIGGLLDNHSLRARLTAEMVAAYRPTPWSAAADAIVAAFSA